MRRKKISKFESCVCSVGKRGDDKPCIMHTQAFYRRQA